jgi:protein SCO1
MTNPVGHAKRVPIMSRVIRLTFLSVILFLAGCGPQKPWHATDITGSMPKLEFAMMRASDGNAATADDYRGRVVMLYFGYTHCPDVCPATLANLSDVLNKLGPDADKVRVLFVTVDPNRDTLALLKQYTQAFAPQIDGLRGTDNQLANLARRYRVAYSVKTKPEYVVTHSAAVFIFDKDGRARLVTLDTNDTKGLAEDVKRIVEE